MIFPLLRGLLWFHRAPVTWIMVAINVGMFAMTFPAYLAADQAIETLLDDDTFIETNGVLFAATMKLEGEPAGIQSLSERSLKGSSDARQLLETVPGRWLEIGTFNESFTPIGDANRDGYPDFYLESLSETFSGGRHDLLISSPQGEGVVYTTYSARFIGN